MRFFKIWFILIYSVLSKIYQILYFNVRPILLIQTFTTLYLLKHWVFNGNKDFCLLKQLLIVVILVFLYFLKIKKTIEVFKIFNKLMKVNMKPITEFNQNSLRNIGQIIMQKPQNSKLINASSCELFSLTTKKLAELA